jgi:hypothetical protein
LALSACAVEAPSQAEGSAQKKDTGLGWVEIDSLKVSENSENVLSRYVSWHTSEPVLSQIDIDCGDFSASFIGEEPRTEHEVFLMGLYAEASCTLVASAEGAAEDQVLQFDVDSLPDILPVLDIIRAPDGEIQPGWNLLNLSDGAEQGAFKVALVDELGRIRWYYELSGTMPGSDNETLITTEGVLIGGTLSDLIWPTLVSWEGQVLWQEEIPMHHDIRLYEGDENRLIYLSQDIEPCSDGTPSGTIEIWDKTASEILWKWTTCEHYPLETPMLEGLHLNALDFFDDGEALLLSARNIHQLIKIDRETGEVLWTLGIQGDFELPAGERFWMQHAPELQEDGSILLFDNGMTDKREFSRVLNLSYDTDTWTAQVNWVIRPSPDIFSPIWGDADRLSNGNILATFGHGGESLISSVIEFDEIGQEIWRLETPLGWGIYRTDRVEEQPSIFTQVGG